MRAGTDVEYWDYYEKMKKLLEKAEKLTPRNIEFLNVLITMKDRLSLLGRVVTSFENNNPTYQFSSESISTQTGESINNCCLKHLLRRSTSVFDIVTFLSGCNREFKESFASHVIINSKMRFKNEILNGCVMKANSLVRTQIELAKTYYIHYDN